MTTDELIRTALARAAEMAPDPVRVHAALAGRARTRRVRRVLLTAVGTAAGVAVAAAVVSLWPSPDHQPVAPTPICTVAVYLDNRATPDQIQLVDAALRQMTEVRELDFDSQAEAYENFKKMFRDAPDLVDSVRPDTLPPSFRFTVTGADGYAAVAARVKGMPGVTDVIFQGCLSPVPHTPTR